MPNVETDDVLHRTWTMAQVIDFMLATLSSDDDKGRDLALSRLAIALEKTGPIVKDGEIWWGCVNRDEMNRDRSYSVVHKDMRHSEPDLSDAEIGLKFEARIASEVLFPSDVV